MPQVEATSHAQKVIRTGARVRVVEGSGIESGKEYTVINRRDIPTDGRGIPNIGMGHYKPMAKDEVALRADDGTLNTMYASRLRVIG